MLTTLYFVLPHSCNIFMTCLILLINYKIEGENSHENVSMYDHVSVTIVGTVVSRGYPVVVTSSIGTCVSSWDFHFGIAGLDL